MTVLVTGGRGFLASHLAVELRRRHPSARLALLDRIPGSGVTVCDLRDPDEARRAVLRFNPSHIYHLAGTTRPLDWEGLWEAHVSTTINVMTAARALPPEARPRVVVVGSASEYGRSCSHFVSERSPCDPVTLYGASKYSQTLAALSFRHDGVPVIIARPFNVIGPGMPENLALGAFSRQLTLIARGEQPPRLKVGDLSPRRDFIDARDTARALADLGRAGVAGEIYNISSGHAVSIAELLHGLLRVSGLKVAVRTDPARVRYNEVKVIAGDHRRLSALTGWKPRISLSRTLRDLWVCLGGSLRAERPGL